MLNKSKKFLPFIFSFLVFLGFQLLVFNKGLNFRDEGFLLNNAIRILNGEIPYRDFFLTTTPGTYYLQSLVFQLFGIHIILDRILYIVFVGLLLLIINFLLDNFRASLKALILSLISLVFVTPAAFAFYNLEGLVFFLLATLLFKHYAKTKLGIFLVGVVLGLLMLFKQSYGVYAMIGFLILLAFNLKTFSKQAFYLILGFAGTFLPFIAYCFLSHALPQFIYFTGVFSEEVKSHRTPFILTSLLLIPFSLFVLSFLKKLPKKKAFVALGVSIILFFLIYIGISPARLSRLSTYAKDPLIYYYGFLLVFPLLVISKFAKTKANVRLYAVLLLSLFLGGASSGRDFTTVLVSLPLVILLLLELRKVFDKKITSLAIAAYFSFPLIFFILLLPNFFNPGVYVQSTIPHFEAILLPKQTEIELALITEYIQSKTGEKETILCFPYCPMVNVLAQRKSSSYFSFFYQETIRAKDQARVISDLKTSKTKLIVLQKPGTIEKEALYEDKRLALLKSYFLANYHLTFSTPNFSIYEK